MPRKCVLSSKKSKMARRVEDADEGEYSAGGYGSSLVVEEGMDGHSNFGGVGTVGG